MTKACGLELHIIFSKLTLNIILHTGNAHECEFKWAEFKIWVENYSDGSGN